MASDILSTLRRAAGLRCPHCGTPWRRRRWIILDPRCASCRLRIDRGENDYFLGSYTLNLFFALIAAAAIAVVAVLMPGRGALIYLLVLPTLTSVTIWLYPVSRLAWLALDLLLRPVQPADFADNAAES